MEEITFNWCKVISEFTDNLIVLLLDWVFEAIDEFYELLPFEKPCFVLFDLLFHFGGFVEVWKFLRVEFGELDHFFRFFVPLSFALA